jgi:hypothetical protein
MVSNQDALRKRNRISFTFFPVDPFRKPFLWEALRWVFLYSDTCLNLPLRKCGAFLRCRTHMEWPIGILQLERFLETICWTNPLQYCSLRLIRCLGCNWKRFGCKLQPIFVTSVNLCKVNYLYASWGISWLKFPSRTRVRWKTMGIWKCNRGPESNRLFYIYCGSIKKCRYCYW